MSTEKTYHAADRVGITSRIVTAEGFLVVPGTLARTGVQEYRAYELGLDADGTRALDPLLRCKGEAVEAGLHFNPVKFDGIKTGVVDLLPERRFRLRLGGFDCEPGAWTGGRAAR